MNIIEVAMSQKDIKENGLNNIIYNTWYYNRAVQGVSYPYCAVFVSWCAYKAGLSTDVIPKTASVKSMYNFFVQQKVFHENIGYIPQVGDLMIQRSNGASHIGIVLQADTDTFTTIEGNAGRGIEVCTHSYRDNTITGFASPKYPSKVSFNLLQFAGDNKKVSVMSEQEIWDFFKSNGYDNYATSGMMGLMRTYLALPSAPDSPYNPRYSSDDTKLWSKLGVLGFSWGPYTKLLDVDEMRKAYPNSTINVYMNWCESHDPSYLYESSINQLTFFWENVQNNNAFSDLKPSNLNYAGTSDPTKTEMKSVITNAASTLKRVIRAGDGSTSEVMNLIEQSYKVSLNIYDSYKDRTSATVPANDQYTQSTEQPMSTETVVVVPTTTGRYEYVTYTVQSGDTLESIAEKYKTTPQLILFTNNLTTWKLKVGQTLKIPTINTTLSKKEASDGTDPLKAEDYTYVKEYSVSHPTAIVEFYGEYGKLAAKSTIGKTEEDKHMENDIISITTTRQMGSDCPTFSVTLVWRNLWYDNIASNDLVKIKMYRPDDNKKYPEVFFGLVDDIRRTIDWSNNHPKRSVRIQGRGVNKAFILFDISIIKDIVINTTAGIFEAFQSLHNQSSASAMSMVVNSYLGKGMNYRFGNSLSGKTLETLKDIIMFSWNAREKEYLFNTTDLTNFSGTLWNFLKGIENAPFNETFWEVYKSQPVLVHRPTPFLKDRWLQLPRTTIKDADLASNETGRTDLETYTVYQVYSQQLSKSENQNYWMPIWYPPYYSKYGLRMLEISSRYSMYGGTGSKKSEWNPRELIQELFNYYIKNNVFENGTLVVKGSNKYHIGERVFLEEDNMEFYVENVSHSFNMYQSWTTSLGVTRGIHPEERFTPPYGAGEDLTGDQLAAIISMTGTANIDWANLPKSDTMRLNSKGQYIANSPVSGKLSGDKQWYLYAGQYFTFPTPTCTYRSSPYGYRTHPVYGDWRLHSGIDLCMSTGDSLGQPIYSAGDGVVTYAGALSGYGNYIAILHSNGIKTGYAHMFDQDIMVSVGDQVKAGQQIAKVGEAGIGTGAHLHFELIVNATQDFCAGTTTDPEEMFATPVTNPTSDTVSETELDNLDSDQESVANACYEFFTKNLGLNTAAACAILGNIEQESSFDINKLSGNAYGLFQWDNRHQSLIDWCRATNHREDTLSGQLAFFQHELETSESRSLPILQSIPNTREGAVTGAITFGEAYERYGIAGDRAYYSGCWYDRM